MFVKNAWYVGAWADELDAGRLLARTICGEDVVFFRLADGAVSALEDRCCHRGLPLSHGSVQGDKLECGYHGLCFDREGICVRVPGQDRVPAAARVRHFPVVEQDRLVWIWMGEAALADASTIVRHRFHDEPGWAWTKDCYRIAANYQLITDNLMDLTHVGYVHRSTIGGTPQAHSDAETKTERTASGVKVSRWMPNSVPPPSYTAAVQFKTERVDRWMEIEFFAPAVVRIHTGAINANTGAAEGKRDGGFAFMGLNVQTPETETTTHYFWSGARNASAGQGGVDPAAQLRASLTVTFAEDKVICEAQQASLDRKPDAQLVMIATDAGMMAARRCVTQMLAAEAQSSLMPADLMTPAQRVDSSFA